MALRGCYHDRNLTDNETLVEWETYRLAFANLHDFYHGYHSTHGYLSSGVCALGALMNLVNLVVLTRPNMVNTVNVVLTAIAASDVCLSLAYLVYLSHFVLLKANYFLHFHCDPDSNTYGWALFQLFYANLSSILHAISLWLAVGMAALRYVILSRLQPASALGLNPAYALVGLSTLLVIICSVPNFLSYQVQEVRYRESDCILTLQADNPVDYEAKIQEFLDTNVIIYTLILRDDTCALRMTSFWLSGLFLKILPCAMLSVFMGLLLGTMFKHHKRHVEVLSAANRPRSRHTERTTCMLVMIVSVFLLTEVPQGVVTILSGLLEEWFYDNVYKALGDILDLLSLLNALVTFPLYCSMSQNYRRTFTRIFLNTDRWQQVRTYVDSRMSIRNGNVTGVISDKRSARYCEANGLELRGVTV